MRKEKSLEDDDITDRHTDILTGVPTTFYLHNSSRNLYMLMCCTKFRLYAGRELIEQLQFFSRVISFCLIYLYNFFLVSCLND